MNRTKRSLVVVAATVVVGSGIFYACKKDPVNGRVNNPQTMGMAEGDCWKIYERYSPPEAEIGEKLLALNNYVNNPDATESMPDMELKEAIWFMETYFNIAVCGKQEFSLNMYGKRKVYEMEIPFEVSAGEEGLILNGEVLQATYRNFLKTIVQTVCPENIINFGDVYVQNLNWGGTVTLGIEIIYGLKEQLNASDQFLYSPFKYNKMVSATTNMVYPAGVDVPRQYKYSEIMGNVNPQSWNNYYFIVDEFLECVINQERTRFVPTGIWEVCCGCAEVMDHTCLSSGFPHHFTSSYPIQADEYDDMTPSLDKNDYVYYGSQYRDYIYDKKLRVCKVGCCVGYNHFWGISKYIIKGYDSNPNQGIVRQLITLKECTEFLDPDAPYMGALNFVNSVQ